MKNYTVEDINMMRKIIRDYDREQMIITKTKIRKQKRMKKLRRIEEINILKTFLFEWILPPVIIFSALSMFVISAILFLG